MNTLNSLLGQALPGCETEGWNESTRLMGALPEFDSMSVITVITLFEETLGIMIDDADISASDFETVGSLLNWVRTLQS